MVSRLAREQVAAGWNVSVASPATGMLPAAVEAAGASSLTWEAGRAPNAATIAETRQLRRLVAQVRPDVIHLHSSKAGLAGRLAVRGRTPTVFSPHAWSHLHMHGPARTAARSWERASARWADVVLCVSEDEAATGAADGIRATYRTIANSAAIDHPGLTQVEARRELGLETDGTILVLLGRYAVQKGQDILLQAWPSIHAQVPTARLYLVGHGPDEAALRAAAPEGVELVPAGDRERVARWILSSDVMAFPSRWEGLSLTVLEALELGRPVVVSDCQGMAEALEGGAGRMVPREDPAALAEAIVPYLADRAYAAAEGLRAAERYQQVHAANRERRFLEYQELLASLIAQQQ